MNNLPVSTISFILLIVTVFLISMFKFTEKSAHEAPGILITIGIFATFFGIAIGLYDFDIKNVETSLPELIGGIKIAFFSSVAGIGAALLVKIRYATLGAKNSNDVEEGGGTVDDLIMHSKKAEISLEKLHKAMIGGEDATLLTQLKLIRTDQKDGSESLRKAFLEFAEKQADNNSKALIDALKEVIRDFNSKINEQFGENFKQLNQAVGKINEWQEIYRNQMTELIQQQKQTTASMKLASDSFMSLVENAKSFSLVAQDLQVTITNMAEIESTQRSHMKEFATLVSTTRSGLPVIESKIVEIINQISDGTKETTASIKKQNGDILKCIEDTHIATQRNATSLSTNLTISIQKHNESIGANITEMVQRTQQQVIALDTELAAALKKSLEALGQQLASLSSKFVQDYGPLTERLRELVAISKKV